MRKGDGGWGMEDGGRVGSECSRLIRDVCGRRVAGPVHDDEPKDKIQIGNNKQKGTSVYRT